MRFRKPFAVAAVVLVLCVLGMTRTTLAQPSNNPILAIVESIQSKLDSLVTSVNIINTNTAPGTVLFTPTLVAFPPDTFSCAATNVSSVSLNITVQLIDGNSAAVLAASTTDVSAGRTLHVSKLSPTGGLRAYCRIQVDGGVKTDVRGVLALFNADTAPDRDPVLAQ